MNATQKRYLAAKAAYDAAMAELNAFADSIQHLPEAEQERLYIAKDFDLGGERLAFALHVAENDLMEWGMSVIRRIGGRRQVADIEEAYDKLDRYPVQRHQFIQATMRLAA